MPASAIKVHQRVGGRTVEKTLPERLAELGVASDGARPQRDRVEPVRDRARCPARDMRGAWPDGVPPRAAFTFSIFPYGSTNFVITDVIEGSHEAIVGPGQHQLLFANVDGEQGAVHGEPRRGPAGPAEARARAEGAGDGRGRAALLPDPGAAAPRRRRVQLSNMGTPPWNHAFEPPVTPSRPARPGRRAMAVVPARSRADVRGRRRRRRPANAPAAAAKTRAKVRRAGARTRASYAWRSATARPRAPTTRAAAIAARAPRSRSG